jgi:hypothetical protein
MYTKDFTNPEKSVFWAMLSSIEREARKLSLSWDMDDLKKF